LYPGLVEAAVAAAMESNSLTKSLKLLSNFSLLLLLLPRPPSRPLPQTRKGGVWCATRMIIIGLSLVHTLAHAL
jgi:hypothetical protein